MALNPEPDHPYLKCITNSKQVCSHPVNFSPTKQQWSFPHRDRIPKPPGYSLNPVGYHDVNQKIFRSTFAVGIGVGKKAQIATGDKHVPGPDVYFPRNLSIGFQKKNGYSFGLSRERVPQPGTGQILKNAGKFPGPDAYTPAFWKTGRCVTFKIKPALPNHGTAVGPGQYPIVSFVEAQKKACLSSVKGVRSPKYPPIGKGASRSRVLRPQSTSATMTCDLKYQINSKGSFFNSKYPNSACRLFNKEVRSQPIKPDNIVGPGAYNLPSDFGIYQSSKAV
jgi:hypothetical protein